MNHQQLNAEKQRKDIESRILKALAVMRAEIASARKKGQSVKRISRNEILRRAGNIDKNTLKRPYHAKINAAVDDFLAENTLTKKKQDSSKSMTEIYDLGYYAQMLVAAQVTRDAAQAEADRLKAHLAVLEEENRNLKTQLSAVGGGNVRPITPRLSGRD